MHILSLGISCKILHTCLTNHLKRHNKDLWYYYHKNKLIVAAYSADGKKYIVSYGEADEQKNIYVAKYDPFFAKLSNLSGVIIFGDSLIATKGFYSEYYDGESMQCKTSIDNDFNNGYTYYYDSINKILVNMRYNKPINYIRDVRKITIKDNTVKCSIGITRQKIRFAGSGVDPYSTASCLYKCTAYISQQTKDILIHNKEHEFVGILPCVSWKEY